VEWAELLDEMEGRLAATRATLHEGSPAPARFLELQDMSRLPEELRERAARILVETRRLEVGVRAARDRLSSARLRSVARPRTPSTYVDTRT
jgi:hypothetical protein